MKQKRKLGRQQKRKLGRKQDEGEGTVKDEMSSLSAVVDGKLEGTVEDIYCITGFLTHPT